MIQSVFEEGKSLLMVCRQQSGFHVAGFGIFKYYFSSMRCGFRGWPQSPKKTDDKRRSSVLRG